MKVVKRDGKIVDFDEERIRIAIGKANEEVDDEEKATDEEINEEYYKILKPYIAREYMLVNDENQNRTSVENHYFFEV